MNNLKKLRQAQKFTQAALANKLGITQQTVQRWETNKTNISSKALKDLAVILNCSVDEIMGTSTIQKSNYPKAFIDSLETEEKRLFHYGGVTLGVKGISELIDYPIDNQAAKDISWYLRSPEDDLYNFAWMHFKTMNNYIVFINLKSLKIAQVYTENYEASPTFYHSEVYQMLTNWDGIDEELEDSDIAEEFETSEEFLELIREIINKYQSEQENWDSWEHFHCLKVYWDDGAQTYHYLDEQLYYTLNELKAASDAPDLYPEANLGTRFLQEKDEGGYVNFLNLDHIALIEVPAIKYSWMEDEDDSI